jgi:hypothetical protein
MDFADSSALTDVTTRFIRVVHRSTKQFKALAR